MGTDAPQATDTAPQAAIINVSYTPYRDHVCRRLARELKEIQLWNLFTHEVNPGASWALQPPPQIHPVSFGHGQLPPDVLSASGTRSLGSRMRAFLSEWRKGGRITEWIRQHPIRAVIICGYNDLGRLRIIRWCRRHRVPYFICADSNIRLDRASGIKGWMKKLYVDWVMRGASGALPSGNLGREYFQKYGTDPDRIFLFPLEPDYESIRKIDAALVQTVQAQFQLNPHRRRILFSGRMIQVKRVDLLIDAFVSIAKERPEWDLLLVGDGPLRKSLEGKVPVELASRVAWTGYIAQQEVVNALYHLGDVLVLPSSYDAWALVINEATAAGLAIVASSVVGAAAELVRDGVNGRIFPSEQLAPLVQALLDVTDPDRIDAMKAASPGILNQWRQEADPVSGLRAALRSCGAIPEKPQLVPGGHSHCNGSEHDEKI